MKLYILSAGVALLVSAPLAYTDTPRKPTYDPCFNVTIQNDPMNESSVRQNCDHNISRTVQAGAVNRAQTIQTGGVNNNKVRQYQYDRSKYFDRIRDK